MKGERQTNMSKNKGENNPMFGKKHSEETKKKIAESRKKYSGKNHPSWKGGRRVSANGYIELHMPEHHRSRGNGYVFEHIVVAEKKISRKLIDREVVHHINRNKQDNRQENLQVLLNEEHSALHGAEKEKTGKTMKCMHCGNGFYAKPSHINKRKTCSKRCAALMNGLPFSRKKEKCINE
jgi:hypothetical protein